MQYDLCCVGHITLDKVITPRNTVHMPGGTSFYCSYALSRFTDIRYKLITALAGSAKKPIIVVVMGGGVTDACLRIREMRVQLNKVRALCVLMR